MLAPTALFLVGLAVFLGVCWLRAVRECHRLRFERLAEKTLAVGRLLQTLAGDGTRRN
jgi:hypothetical protein